MKLWLIFFAALAAASFGISSCTEEITEQAGDYGQESTAADRNKMINDAFNGISIENESIGARVLYENNQRIELGPVRRTSSIEHELIDIKEYPDSTGYVMKETITLYDVSTGAETDRKTSETPPLLVKKDQAQVFRQKAFDEPLALIKKATLNALNTACDGVDQDDGDGLQYDCIRYFNLRSEIRKIPPPTPVKSRPDCMGLENCEMTIRFVAYDEVKWRANRAVKRLHIEAEIAPQVPDIMYIPSNEGWSYIPPVLSLCERFLHPIDGALYMVALCTVLRDFQIP